jgi:hypothetical protein
VRPAGSLGHKDPVVVGGRLSPLLSLLLGSPPLEVLPDDLLPARLEDVRGALQEQHPEDVLLELRSIHLAAENVRSRIQVPFQLGKGEAPILERRPPSAPIFIVFARGSYFRSAVSFTTPYFLVSISPVQPLSTRPAGDSAPERLIRALVLSPRAPTIS